MILSSSLLTVLIGLALFAIWFWHFGIGYSSTLLKAVTLFICAPVAIAFATRAFYFPNATFYEICNVYLASDRYAFTLVLCLVALVEEVLKVALFLIEKAERRFAGLILFGVLELIFLSLLKYQILWCMTYFYFYRHLYFTLS